MAIVSSGSFAAASSKIAGNTLAFTSSQNILAGDLAVLFVAMDNPTTGTATNFVTSVRDNSINYNFQQGTGFNATARTIVTQSDGKILVGGDFTTYNGVSQSYAVRLNTDGTLDTTFGYNISGSVYKLAIQPDVTGSYYSSLAGWSTGGSMITARTVTGTGTQNAALAIGGFPTTNITEEYDGTVWTAGGALITARYGIAGAGTQNEGLAIGGFSPACSCTEEYNGTSWSTGGNLITARGALGGAGIQNAATAFGGNAIPLASTVTCTEEYDGSVWVSCGALIISRRDLTGVGTQNLALAFGGFATAQASCTEEYNGSTWTAGGALITARFGVAGAGTQNAALAFGGSFPVVGCTEAYNGTSWTTTTALITARATLGGAGTQDAALAFGGTTPAPLDTTCTEEYSGTTTIGTCISDKIIAAGTMTGGAIRLNPDGSEDPSFNKGTGFNNTVCTVIVQETGVYTQGGTWSAGGALITARYDLTGTGTQNSGLAIGGFSNTSAAALSCTEEYDGASWTSGGVLITARYSLASAGTQNEALAFGGNSPTNNLTEEYNGSTWAAGGTLITARSGLSGAGTQNAALAFGGNAIIGHTEEYNGTVWTTGGDLINARSSLAGAGTQNAALAFGGTSQPSFVFMACTEEYDGASWIAGGALITARSILAGDGTQNEALAFGGCVTTQASCTEEYDGSIWTIGGNLINSRDRLAGAGNQTAGLAVGGLLGATDLTYTEEYSVSNTTYTNKLIFGGAFTSYNNSTYSGSARIQGGGAIDTSFDIGSGFSPVDVRCYQFYNSTSSLSLGSVWSNGGALIQGRNNLAGAGAQNASLAFGGSCVTPSISCLFSCTEEYDGSVWTAGGALICGRSGLAGNGTQNAALAVGGTRCVTPWLSCTEEYDGSVWAAGGALICGRQLLAGAGTQDAALAFGGIENAPSVLALSCTEEYDGTTWTAGGTLITARYGLAGAGTQNEALAFGGSAPGPNLGCTEEYNGTSWSAGGALITARQSLAGAGTQNEALAFGGSAAVTCTEAYNGTSWAVGNSLITGRDCLEGTGAQPSALAFGGTSPSLYLSCTEEFTAPPGLLAIGNFTSVSGSLRNRIALLNADTGDLIPTSSFNIGSAGFNAAANSIAVLSDNSIVAVGAFTAYSGSNINRIVKLNTNGTLDTAFSASIGAGLNNTGSVVVNYPSSSIGVWLAGGALITARSSIAGTGTQNEALAIGNLTTTEEYNGSTWAAGGALIVGRQSSAAAGIQNEGLVFGGINAASCACTEEYNGSTWTAGGNLITARYFLAGAGTQNLALAIGGNTPTVVGATEEYDGTSWTAGNALITARCALAGAGTQNAGLAFGGATPTEVRCTEEYDGTTWTAGGALINTRAFLAGGGTQNAGIAFGGFANPLGTCVCTEIYDGTIWSTGGSLITSRYLLAGAGTQNAALAFGGNTIPVSLSCTEEYTTRNALLVGGVFTTFAGNTRSGSVKIYDVGNLDNTFSIGSGFGAAVDVKDFYIHSDQDIIVVGGFTTYSGSFAPSPNRIVKINANGSIDAASTGNVWSKVSERSSNDAAGAGATLALFYLTASYDIPAGTSITASLSASVTAKAATGWRFATDTPAIVYTGSVTSSAAGGTSQPVRINLANLTSGSGNYLFIRGVAFENDTVTAFTPTANYTTMSAAGTTGGAAITNQSVRGEFRVLTTASYFSNPTLGVASSQASIFWTFYESAAVAGGRTYFILLD